MAGRPSKFKPEFIKLASQFSKLGATDLEIADALGVNVATFNRWKLEHADFCASIKDAKTKADQRVERSLFVRATGYEHDEVDIRVVNGKIVKTAIRKFYPPDTTAAIFWLKNRQPAGWRETKAVELSGPGGKDLSLHVTNVDTAVL